MLVSVRDMTDVVLPCRNEAAALPGLLARIPAGYRPIVVDNGSTDGSAEVARAHGAEVISVAEPGYGAAVHAGVEAADPIDGVVCVMDADGSFDPTQLPRLAGCVRTGQAQLATGRRRPVGRGMWPLHARAANAFLAHRLRARPAWTSTTSARCGRYGRDDLLALGLRDRRFGYPLELLIAADRAGWRVVEIDVDYGPRAAGTRSKVTGTLLGTARAVRDMSAVLAR